MDYQQAADIRKKGLFSTITDKLVAGQGIGSSVGGAISEKTQATVKGFKEKFDILNIAKTLTGGSNFAPALLGKVLGRKKEDIAYFAGAKNKKVGGLSSTKTNEMAIEILGLIYREMVKTEEQRKIDFADAEEEKNNLIDAEEQRNSAIIAALSGKKVKTKKIKVRKVVKENKDKEQKKLLTTKKTLIGKALNRAISTVTKVGVPTAILGAAAGGAVVLGGLSLSQAVGAAEAGGSYDVAFGDRENPKTGKITNRLQLKTAEEFSGKKLSDMTLEEVKKFQEYRNKTKSNTGAVGKYQFIQSTLFGKNGQGGLVQKLGLSMDTKFSPQVQDKLNETFFQDNMAILKSKGVPITPGNAYMAHYIGAGGAAVVYQAAQKGQDITVAQALVNAGLPDPSTQNEELKRIKVKDFEFVLQERLEKKGYKSQPQDQNLQIGNQLDQMSKQNKDAKKDIDQSAIEIKKVNTNTITSTGGSTQPVQIEKEDDRNAYDKKVGKK
jgi:hypothetical protein